MGKTLKEMGIIRKYSTEWAVITLVLTVPARTTVTVTYNPPQETNYVFDYSSVGPMTIVSSLVTGEVFWDGTRAATFINQGALEDKVFGQGEAPLKIAKNELKFVIRNRDTISHTVDSIFYGFIVNEGDEKKLIEEITGKTDITLLTDIKDLLTKIDRKLSG